MRLAIHHTHRDHSPAARALQAATGAPTYANADPHGFSEILYA
jgi:glyoxylase-like metal-dependent hydrolase (beta-lactamase superfamily II)